jgi:tripartite-type tricarboxylate transporter receptor subunit TctC
MKKFLTAILLSASTIFAHAWEPSTPITVVVPNAPGAGNELAFRILAKQVEEQAKVKFVFDYKPGAGDTIAMNHLNTLKNDGHHIGIPACQSTYVTAEIWYPNYVKFNQNISARPIQDPGRVFDFGSQGRTSVENGWSIIQMIPR